MKKILLLCFIATGFCSKAQYVSIPDPNFRSYLISHFPTCFNTGQMMDTTCNGIVNTVLLNVGSLSITNLDGIQYFDHLQNLDVSFNQLSLLPVLPNSVTTLACQYNLLSMLPDMPDMVTMNCAHNNIGSLPNLPVIQSLNCESNQLTSLPNLPNVSSLNCGGNYLTQLPNLPTVAYLHCESNLLTSLPVFPNALYLGCSYNQLTNLPVLSNTLIELWCTNNQLHDLPDLPNTLTHLYCSGNKLFDLPSLPDSLSVLYCYDNDLFRLPTLPSTMTEILCGTNLITALPALPNSMGTLFCNDNKLLECLPKLPPNLATLFTSGSGVSCLPNYTNFITTGGLCGNSCTPHATCSGIVFFDSNSNGVFDTGLDYPLNGWVVSNSRPYMATSSAIGEYSMKLDSSEVNTIKVKPLITYSSAVPASYTLTPPTSTFVGGNFNFAVQMIPNVKDLRVDIYKNGARPGSDQWVSVSIENAGTVNMTNATLKILKPASFTFVSATPAISAQLGDTLVWNNIDIDFLTNKDFSLTWSVPTSIPVGTPYQIQAWALPIIGDTVAGDNHVTVIGVTVASCDPNGKEVSKTTLLESALGEELKYTVYFQNTGTDTAFNIIVRDQLSSNLDLSTFKMLGSSHTSDFLIRENGLLEVFFQQIKLVDSLTNEPESHGFFQYSVKPKSNLKAGSVIPNTAGIYFDYNLPVITNTVNTYIVYPNRIDELATVEAAYYPNPTTGKITLILSEPTAFFSVMDINGRVLYQSQVGKTTELDLSAYADGLYIGKVETPKGSKILKIVKQQ